MFPNKLFRYVFYPPLVPFVDCRSSLRLPATLMLDLRVLLPSTAALHVVHLPSLTEIIFRVIAPNPTYPITDVALPSPSLSPVDVVRDTSLPPIFALPVVDNRTKQITEHLKYIHTRNARNSRGNNAPPPLPPPHYHRLRTPLRL